ncbi:pentapeptide repeat-containing protein, partial [Mycobacterium sp.]|uniref:pentapeptide repeat-containing protein n=1 Tax=Mycobacterium sp. TaxID=1785 RepID=UPI003A863747
LGSVNTGSFNTGDFNTGWANSGDLNTGAFVSGNENNGLFWRGDRHGLIAGDYTVTIPEIPITLGGGGMIKLPITGEISAVSIEPFAIRGAGGGNIPVDMNMVVDGNSSGANSIHIRITNEISFNIPINNIPIKLGIPLVSSIEPIQFPRITIAAIPLNLTLGSDTTMLDAFVSGYAGPITIPAFHLPPVPGFFNSDTASSSGFFNSGADNSSGVGNIGDNLSGISNVGAYISGFENYGGSLLSGLANLGSRISGGGNTGVLAGLISGIGNIGSRLSGLFLADNAP